MVSCFGSFVPNGLPRSASGFASVLPSSQPARLRQDAKPPGADPSSARQDTMALKRQAAVLLSQQPKRTKHQSRIDAYMKIESHKATETICEDSVLIAAGADAGFHRIAPPPPSLNLEDRKLNSGASITSKMLRYNNLGERIKGCRDELKRIAGDLTALETTACNFVLNGNATWIVTGIAALGEEKYAVKLLLDKTVRKLQARERKIEKKCKQDAERKEQLEAKRLANKQQIKVEGGKNVAQVDFTSKPKGAKIESEAHSEAQPLKVETKIAKEEADSEKTPMIKVEPKIKIEIEED